MGPWGCSRVGVARGSRGVVVALFLLVACLMGAREAMATFAGRDGEILSTGDGGMWLSGPHGHGSHPFPAPPVLLKGPPVFDAGFYRFSPSGRQIAILVNTDRDAAPPLQFGVEITNAGGKGTRVVTRGKLPTSLVRMSGLAFSPNGRQFVVAYAYGGLPYFTRVVFVNVKTGRVVRSLVLRGEVDSVVWSANGNLLLVPDDGPLLTMRPSGTGRHRIKIRFPGGVSTGWMIDSSGEDSPVAPSPDGSQLAVSSTTGFPDGDTDVFLVPAAGGRAQPLGTKDDELCCAIWSPNGRQLIVESGAASDWQLETLATRRRSKLDVPGLVLDWQALPR